MIRRTASVLLTGILLGAVLVAPAPAVAAGCAGGQSVETYDVLTKWNKTVYRPGETLKVEVTVQRPARKDPFGFGIPIEPVYQSPVEDATVVVAFSVGVPPVWGMGTTDADGKLQLKIPLKTKVRGPIASTTRAWKIYGEGLPDCFTVEEWGRLLEYPAFEIRED